MKAPISLEKWAPQQLSKFYLHAANIEKTGVNAVFGDIEKALFRLGTGDDMQNCWKLLRSKSVVGLSESDTEDWVVCRIYALLTDLFIKGGGALIPSKMSKEINAVIRQVEKLILSIHESPEALMTSFSTTITHLSSQAMEFDNELSKASMWERRFICDLGDEFQQRATSIPDDASAWGHKSDKQKLIWLGMQTFELTLLEQLKTYAMQLNESVLIYKSKHSLQRPRVIRELYEIMLSNYSEKGCAECILSMSNAILDEQFGIEDVTPYKPKKKKIVKN